MEWMSEQISRWIEHILVVYCWLSWAASAHLLIGRRCRCGGRRRRSGGRRRRKLWKIRCRIAHEQRVANGAHWRRAARRAGGHGARETWAAEDLPAVQTVLLRVRVMYSIYSISQITESAQSTICVNRDIHWLRLVPFNEWHDTWQSERKDGTG